MRLDDSIDKMAGTARVLFVDDDPLVTRSLRRTLTGRGLPWEVHFTETGESALAHLDREPCAVIVSDLTMPGMDGRELLERVQAAHPRVARIVLSGIADPSHGAVTIPGAHLSLAKPFDPQPLVDAISRAVDLHALLVRPSLCAAFGPALPEPPPVCAAVARVLAREASSVWDVIDVLEAHPGLSSRLTRLLASCSPPETYRPRAKLVSHVASIDPAALRGLLLLAELGETIALCPMSSKTFSVDAFERRAVRAACLAARIVGRRSATERAFVAGLFHEVGDLVLAAMVTHAVPASAGRPPAGPRERLDDVVAGSSETDARATSGFSRAEAGAFVLGLFGFPLETIDAILGRHDAVECENGGLDVASAAYVASVLSRDSDAPIGPGIVKGLDPERLGRASDLRRVEQWRRAARQLIGRATA